VFIRVLEGFVSHPAVYTQRGRMANGIGVLNVEEGLDFPYRTWYNMSCNDILLNDVSSDTEYS
jgi:hypothetical protein